MARTTRRSRPHASTGLRPRLKASRRLIGRLTRMAAGPKRPEPQGFLHTSAKMRLGAALAPLTFGRPTISVAPIAGTLSRLVRFSIPQRPDGSHNLWVVKSFDTPG